MGSGSARGSSKSSPYQRWARIHQRFFGPLPKAEEALQQEPDAGRAQGEPQVPKVPAARQHSDR